jgi:hypothetical protein
MIQIPLTETLILQSYQGWFFDTASSGSPTAVKQTILQALPLLHNPTIVMFPEP